MSKLLNNLHGIFNDKDTKTIEFYFELLNVWWLFILWSPSVVLNTGPLIPYRYILAAICLLTIISAGFVLFTGKKLIRIIILLSYVAFYLLTGFNLLLQSTYINPLAGVFICQGILAIALSWKLQARMGNKGETE